MVIGVEPKGSDPADRCAAVARTGPNAEIDRAPSILIGCEGEAAVGVEAARISVGDGIDGLGGGGEQSLRGALRRRSQLLLDLGEGQLNGVEVGGVGRQKQ